MHRARKLNQKSNAILPFCSFNFILFFLHFVAPLIAKHIVKPALTIWAPEWCVHGRLNGSWIEYTKWILCGTKSQMHANARNLIKIRAELEILFFYSFIYCCIQANAACLLDRENFRIKKEKLYYLLTQKMIWFTKRLKEIELWWKKN